MLEYFHETVVCVAKKERVAERLAACLMFFRGRSNTIFTVILAQ